jgi:hypothetical protein
MLVSWRLWRSSTRHSVLLRLVAAVVGCNSIPKGNGVQSANAATLSLSERFELVNPLTEAAVPALLDLSRLGALPASGSRMSRVRMIKTRGSTSDTKGSRQQTVVSGRGKRRAVWGGETRDRSRSVPAEHVLAEDSSVVSSTGPLNPVLPYLNPAYASLDGET